MIGALLLALLLSLGACSGGSSSNGEVPDQGVVEGLRFYDLPPQEGPAKDVYAGDGLDPNDWDRDGLTNDQEKKLGTDPWNPDTDSDGIKDLEEVGDPSKPKDTDQDGKIDAIEPNNFDSDKDNAFDVNDANDLDGPCSPGGSLGPSRLFHQTQISTSIKLTKACSPYKVLRYLEVAGNAVLSTEAGVKITFALGASLAVGNSSTMGNLALVGTSTEPVILTADASVLSKGFWRGVVVENGNNLALQSCTISGAGRHPPSGGTDAAVLVKDAAQITLTGSTFTQSYGYGLYAAFKRGGTAVGKLFSSFENNLFSDLTYAAAININHLGEIGNGNSFGTSGEIHVADSKLEQASTWKALGVSYVFLKASLSIDANLVIQAGSKLIVPANALITVGGGSSPVNLVAQGSSSAPITIQTTSGTPGTWQGIHLGSGAHLLIYTTLKGGGGTSSSSGVKSALYVDRLANLTAQGCVIDGSTGYGVYYLRSGSGCATLSASGFSFSGTIAQCKLYCVDDTTPSGTCIPITSP